MRHYLFGVSCVVAIGIGVFSGLAVLNHSNSSVQGPFITIEIANGRGYIEGFQGESVFSDCRLTNTGSEAVRITNLNVSCPCTKFVNELEFPYQLLPGETKDIPFLSTIESQHNLSLSFKLNAKMNSGLTIENEARVELRVHPKVFAIPGVVMFGRVLEKGVTESDFILYYPKSIDPPRFANGEGSHSCIEINFTSVNDLPNNITPREGANPLGLVTVSVNSELAPEKLSELATLKFEDGFEILVPVTGWFSL